VEQRINNIQMREIYRQQNVQQGFAQPHQQPSYQILRPTVAIRPQVQQPNPNQMHVNQGYTNGQFPNISPLNNGKFGNPQSEVFNAQPANPQQQEGLVYHGHQPKLVHSVSPGDEGASVSGDSWKENQS